MRKKIIATEEIPEIDDAIEALPKDSKIFVNYAFEVAQYLLSALVRLNMSQKELSIELGKSEAEISKWVSGTHNFTLRSIAKIEAVLPIKIMNPAIFQEEPLVMSYKGLVPESNPEDFYDQRYLDYYFQQSSKSSTITEAITTATTKLEMTKAA